MNIIREIKWAWQRVRKGYSDDIKWDFNSYFEQFIEPLQEFCCEQLAEKELMELNPEIKKIYSRTMDLIRKYDIWDTQSQTNLWEYFGKNITAYWN